MYRRTIQWIRPSTDVAWPWEGLSQIDDYNDLIATASGFIGKFNLVNTDTEITNNVDWETKADWQVVADSPITIALLSAQDPLLTERGITKNITETIIEA
jgi:hypothetical protein